MAPVATKHAIGNDEIKIRRRIAGIEPGRTMRVRGRLAVRDGRKVLYNPYYEICQAQ